MCPVLDNQSASSGPGLFDTRTDVQRVRLPAPVLGLGTNDLDTNMHLKQGEWKTHPPTTARHIAQ